MPTSILRCSHDLKRKRKSTRLRSSRLCRVLRKETLFPDQHPSNVQFVSNQLGSQLISSLMWHHKTYQRYHSIGWICLWLSWIIDALLNSSIVDVDVLAKSCIPSKLFVTVLVLLSFLLGAWNPKQSGTKTAKTILSYWIVIDASSTNKPLACFNNLFQVPGDDP